MILVVEGDETMRLVLRVFLEECGYKVLVARDGNEALRMLRMSAPDIKLVLYDIMLPNIDGVELLHQIKAIDAGVRVILGGEVLDRRARAMLEGSGEVGFLHKPYTSEEILGAVRFALGNTIDR
ncbi:MAG: response regulator [Bacteroidota bacterium]